MAFPRRPSAVLRYLIPAFFFVLFFFALSGPDRFPSRSLWSYNYARGEHPIDRLIQQADEEFERKLAKETKTLAEAAAAYRQRRGRHPPPDFDKWWKFATQHNAIIVEEFWDQIYHDLEPFWALSPAQIRKAAWEFEMRIHVRNGKASTESNWFWTQIWLDMLKQIEHLLPDIDIALNAMDEPRIVVPWENMTEYMIKAAETRKIVDVGSVITEFEKRPPPGEGPEKDEVLADKAWETTDSMFQAWLLCSLLTYAKLTYLLARALLEDCTSWLPAKQSCATSRADHRLLEASDGTGIIFGTHARWLCCQLHTQHSLLPPTRPTSPRGHLRPAPIRLGYQDALPYVRRLQAGCQQRDSSPRPNVLGR